jgi:hypothetical protein
MATTTINLGLSLDGLSNVDSAGKANGDILRWNSTTNKWEDNALPTTAPAGSNGQIQFNSSGAFGADSLLVWDNTNKRLGVGASPATTVRLDVRAQGALSTDIAFRVRNSADSADLLSLNGLGNLNLASGGFIYGDTTSPFIRLSNAIGTQIGYGTNFFSIGGAGFNFNTSAAVAPLRYRSIWGMRLQDTGNATDPVNDGLSAMLALGSTTKGFLPPRMTTVQKNDIVAPPSGLLVYDTSLNKLCLFGASSWETITSI